MVRPNTTQQRAREGIVGGERLRHYVILRNGRWRRALMEHKGIEFTAVQTAKPMDSAQHCLDQAAECRRLMKLALSEAEAQALKNLSRTWSGLAGQIDRYNALMREQRRVDQE